MSDKKCANCALWKCPPDNAYCSYSDEPKKSKPKLSGDGVHFYCDDFKQKN